MGRRKALIIFSTSSYGYDPSARAAAGWDG
jgi:hypothetical protein